MNFNRFKGYLPSKKLIENFSYVSLLEVFVLLAPFITYPYLVRILGRELYGMVILAQVLASYASIVIDFGTNKVCAKYVSINREDKGKLSEIVSSVFCFRLCVWVVCLFVYTIIVSLVPSYRAHFLLFLFSYLLTLNDLLFPQYFFQGIEKMKFSSLINIGIKLFFIAVIFIFVKGPQDYLFVPLLYAIGYTLAGVVAMVTIFVRWKIQFVIPSFTTVKVYLHDAVPLFLTDLLVTIKGKLSYIFIGAFVNVSDVVIYDLAYKFNSILGKPTEIISVVLFPRISKSRDINKFKVATSFTFIISLVLVLVLNMVLPVLVRYFINEDVSLLPIRLLSLSPLMKSVGSMISQNLFVAFGYNKYLLYGIIFAISSYAIAFGIFFCLGRISSLFAFVVMDMIFYITDFAYKIVQGYRISRELKKVSE